MSEDATRTILAAIAAMQALQHRMQECQTQMLANLAGMRVEICERLDRQMVQLDAIEARLRMSQRP